MIKLKYEINMAFIERSLCLSVVVMAIIDTCMFKAAGEIWFQKLLDYLSVFRCVKPNKSFDQLDLV